jgi:hypothetical protein
LVAPPVQPLNASTIWVGFDVPATAPAVDSVPAETVGNVTDRSAGAPDATPLIEHVVLDTVPVKVIVPSAAWAPNDATPNKPPVTMANAGRNDFILLLQCVRKIFAKDQQRIRVQNDPPFAPGRSNVHRRQMAVFLSNHWPIVQAQLNGMDWRVLST